MQLTLNQVFPRPPYARVMGCSVARKTVTIYSLKNSIDDVYISVPPRADVACVLATKTRKIGLFADLKSAHKAAIDHIRTIGQYDDATADRSENLGNWQCRKIPVGTD
ncbi:MAG: hypothetical protein WBC93_06085 [Sulfitobacter sp.]